MELLRDLAFDMCCLCISLHRKLELSCSRTDQSSSLIAAVCSSARNLAIEIDQLDHIQPGKLLRTGYQSYDQDDLLDRLQKSLLQTVFAA